MRVVFMGTPDFSVPTLKALAEGGHEILGVFTQPDRPAGRGKKLKPSPVKVAAGELSLPVFQPERIKSAEWIELLHELAPESIIVVAYGQILPKAVLELPKGGCINVHASLLPAYRGAAPIHWAVMQGEPYTGVTTMLMNEGLDTGDMLLKQELVIPAEATTGEIHDQLAEIGAKLLLETLAELEKGSLKPIPQTGDSNYAPLLKREHEGLDWSREAAVLHNQIRGLNPWPGAFASFRGENLKIWRSKPFQPVPGSDPWEGAARSEVQAEPGQIVQVLGDALLVQTGKGILGVLEVQPAGKRTMKARDFFNGRHGQIGEKFQ
ncbi:methionyl-tRNA formyltransferase [Desulfosporosinus orientis DSM 765]|uniref:Methionyl-tRNA formyltransferase n=1 Tax=Desulfosporosinus orientis (strain ATCC 19365 / DSM 765 / NCIMB 8382 / VKM B-1628 / Singapore I) TaxID=768706 RepID=G7WG45_DESOD|nr:methionyl-tRNA formyltransferase [Desulfosporosinus orientis]AET70139.1 methionyl-tRNA formyltransferase [Desulfosporosinus orientis DSM 765]